MAAPGSEWGNTPRQSIELECQRRGLRAVVAGCVALLGGGLADEALLVALAGPAGRSVLDSGPAPVYRYWLRVWGARGLLWAWHDSASDALAAATSDEAWRVREMAAKVVARHRVGAAFEAVEALRDDPVPRVRAAAARAVVVLTASGA